MYNSQQTPSSLQSIANRNTETLQNDKSVALFKTPAKQGLCEVSNGTPSFSSLLNTKTKQLQFTPQILTTSQHKKEQEQMEFLFEVSMAGQEMQRLQDEQGQIEEEQMECLFGASMADQELWRKQAELREIDQRAKSIHTRLEGKQGMPKFARYIGGIIFSPGVDPFGEKFNKLLATQMQEEDEEGNTESNKCMYDNTNDDSSNCMWDQMEVDEIDLISSLPIIEI